MERRLTTILAADVVGYSRLMGADEAGTLAALKGHREELFDPKAAQYRGRTVKLMGDGALMEFVSVVDAVSFAVEVQAAMAARNEGVAEDQRIVFRIGINIGDIIVDGDDIYGDGVNVAARLEALAEPSGICVARNVFDQVKGKLDLTIEHLGEREVKNIAEPVTVYRVVLDDKAAALVTPVVQEATKPANRRWVVAAAAAVLLVATVGGMFWWQPWTPDVEPASVERMAFPLPDKPSIAVLPFTNMSGDPEQEYFTDGITEDLITDLAKIPGLFVISSNSTFTYKGKPVKVGQVAEELGVRYVLEGSVRRVQDKVRINAQLIDATTGGHLWADRYDGSLADVFALQDTVTRSIVAALSVNLTAEEKTRGFRVETASPRARDAFLRGWAHYRRNSPDDFAKALPYLKEAVDLDPEYRRAYAALAAVYWGVRSRGYESRSGYWPAVLGLSLPETLDRAKSYLEKALKDSVPLAHQVASGMLIFQGRHDEAIAEAERAIALDQNDPAGYQALVTALIYAGRPAEAADPIAKAMRLDPLQSHEYLFWLGASQFSMERYDEAAVTLARATQANPDDDRGLIFLAATYGHLERVQEAKSTVEMINNLRKRREKLVAASGIELGVDLFLIGPYSLEDVNLWPFSRSTDRDRLRTGLIKAGIPKVAPATAESPKVVMGAVTVDVEAATALFDKGVKFVDVRGNAYNLGHVPGALHLHLKKDFTEAKLTAALGKDEEVVIYCMGPKCLLSSKACARAVSWGFTKVYYFRDGFPSWKAAGYPIEVQ